MPDIRNDEPINSVVNDLFGFSFQASVIAKLVGGKDSQNHLSVGVSGSWGSGKTSLLNMVRELLEYQKKYKEFAALSRKLEKARFVKDKVQIYKQMVPYRRFIKKVSNSEHLRSIQTNINDVKVIWFDPWFFGSEETVIKAFFYRIAKELVDEDRELSKLFLKLAVVMVGSPDLPESSSLPVVGDALKIINFGRNLINRMSGDDGSIMDFTDIKNKITAKLGETKKRIVIIIDDLDRLQVSEALTMLKVIRLVTEFGVNFVIGYDEETLSATIDNKCGGHGREYIRKMINIPTFMPLTPKNKIEEFLITNFISLRLQMPITKPIEEKDICVFWNTCIALTNTIRKAKHLINSFRQSINVYGLWQDNNLILGLLLLHLYFPVLFNRLKEISPPFVEVKDCINFIKNEDKPENQTINNEAFDKLMGQDQNMKNMAKELCSALFSVYGLRASTPNEKYKKPMYKKDLLDLLSLISLREIE